VTIEMRGTAPAAEFPIIGQAYFEPGSRKCKGSSC